MKFHYYIYAYIIFTVACHISVQLQGSFLLWGLGTPVGSLLLYLHRIQPLAIAHYN